MVALGVAVFLGLLAVFIANGYLNLKERQAYDAGTTKVAVATSPLAYGADITPDKVRFVDYPNTSIPPGAFTTTTQLLPAGKRRVALMPIGPNEPILSSKISGPGQAASIAALLPDGMRAATVKVNDVSGVAGFIQPNDSVDVLITREMAGGDHTAQVTDVLLQNVRVMAIDQQATNADGSPKLAKTATLQVSPLDSQKLALAQEIGTLSLVLRKPGEPNNPVVETVSMNDLRYNMYGGARYPAPAVVGSFGAGLVNGMTAAMNGASAQIASATNSAPPVHPAAARKGAIHAQDANKVQVFRGTKSDEVEVGGR
jgi:pilus assembly protein CpaB